MPAARFGNPPGAANELVDPGLAPVTTVPTAPFAFLVAKLAADPIEALREVPNLVAIAIAAGAALLAFGLIDRAVKIAGDAAIDVAFAFFLADLRFEPVRPIAAADLTSAIAIAVAIFVITLAAPLLRHGGRYRSRAGGQGGNRENDFLNVSLQFKTRILGPISRIVQRGDQMAGAGRLNTLVNCRSDRNRRDRRVVDRNVDTRAHCAGPCDKRDGVVAQFDVARGQLSRPSNGLGMRFLRDPADQRRAIRIAGPEHRQRCTLIGRKSFVRRGSRGLGLDIHPDRRVMKPDQRMGWLAGQAEVPVRRRNHAQRAECVTLDQDVIGMAPRDMRDQRLGEQTAGDPPGRIPCARKGRNFGRRKNSSTCIALRLRVIQSHAPGERPTIDTLHASQCAASPNRSAIDQCPTASRAGLPSHEVRGGRNSPFITTDKSPSWASSPISAS